MIQQIPFGNNQPSLDIPGAQSTQQTGSVMRDVYVDLSGNIVKRPVLDLFCDTGESGPVNGLYDWSEIADGVVIVDGALIAVADGALYQIREYNPTLVAEITAGTSAAFSSSATNRVSFTEHGDDLYAANGGKIKRIRYTGSWSKTDVTDVDAPTTVESLTTIDRYLIANAEDTGLFYWSDVNAPTVWSGYYGEAESKPDNIYHVQEVNGYLYLIGRTSTEVFYDDGVSPFTRLTQGVVPSGASAKRSPQYCDAISTFVWRTQSNRIVKVAGRDVVSISQSLDQFLSFNYETGTKGDVGHYFMWDGIPFYLYSALQAGYSYVGYDPPAETGPTSGFSIAINLLTGDWYEWGAYYATENRYLPFQAASIINTPVGVLAGDLSDGLIHRLTRGGSDDTAYGESTPLVRSVQMTREAPGREKICNSLTFNFRAPQTHTGGSFGVTVKYSDDGGYTWTDGRKVLADVSTGQKAKIITERNWGRYYIRQWQIEFDDTKDVGLGPVMEDFDYV